MKFSTEQQLFLAIRSLDTKLDSVLRRLNSEEQAEWLDTKDTCSMLGCTDRHLRNLMAEGTIAGDCIRNVGTIKRARYKFHRSKVMSQYLKRV